MSALDWRPSRRIGRCRKRLSLLGVFFLPCALLILLCLPRGSSAWWFSPSSSSPPAGEKSRPSDPDSGPDSGYSRSGSSDSSEGSTSSTWKHRPGSEEEDGMGGEEEEAGLTKGRDTERGRGEDSPSSSSSSSRSSSHSSWEEEGSLGDEERTSSPSSGTKSRSHSGWDEEGSSDLPSSSSFDSPSSSLRHGGSSGSRDSSASSGRHRGGTPPGPEEEYSEGTSSAESSLSRSGEGVCPGFPYHTVAAVYLSNLAITCLVAFALLTGLEAIPNCTALRYRRTAVLVLGALAGAFVLVHLATPLGVFDGVVPAFGLVAVVCLVGTAPVVLFREFREILLHTTHPWLLSPHALRVLHFLFLPLYDVRLLPLSFAGPAGWGGLLVGLTAPVVALAFGAQRDFARGLAIVWTAAGALELVGVLVLNAVFIPGFIRASQPGGPDMGFMWHSVFLVVHYTVPVLLVLHGYSLWKLAAQGDTASQPTMIWQEDDAELADIYGPDSPGGQGASEGAFDAFMREASLKGGGKGSSSGHANGAELEKEREMVPVKEGAAHAQNGESEPLKHQEP